jgi:hypothetical protein
MGSKEGGALLFTSHRWRSYHQGYLACIGRSGHTASRAQGGSAGGGWKGGEEGRHFSWERTTRYLPWPILQSTSGNAAKYWVHLANWRTHYTTRFSCVIRAALQRLQAGSGINLNCLSMEDNKHKLLCKNRAGNPLKRRDARGISAAPHANIQDPQQPN